MKGLERWGRRLVRSERLRRALCYTMQFYIRFVYATNRWTVIGAEHPRRLLATGRPFVGAFWHGRMMMIPIAWGRMAPMHMLISPHRDGRIIADAVAYFGIQSVAGSSRRGASVALRALVKLLAAGDCVAITPDGPAGPAMAASSGVVNVARLARVPIQPIVFATSHRWLLRTWDRMCVALPFGRGVILWGEPIEIERDLDEEGIERARLLVEARMREMVALADARVGHRLAAAHTAPGGVAELAGGEGE